ncbi:MAG: acyl-CoA synthetase [Acidimicrobiales bacterium]|nr:acyl-CoA synthetase [Acidimicrobiales bacterium]
MGYQIADLFEHAVDAVPERTALLVGPDRRTYAELEARANQAAHLLSEAGVGRDDFVGLYATNSAAHVELMLGCYKLSAVPVNINYRYVEDELKYLCNDGDVIAIAHDADLGPRVSAVVDDIPELKMRLSLGGPADGAVDYAEAVTGQSADRDFGERSPDDLYVCYTGGTTGMPKGVVWRHEDVFYALGGGFDAYTNEPVPHERFLADRAAAGEGIELRGLTLAPLMHGGGQWGCLRFFFEGNMAVFQPQFDPRGAWELIERERLTNIMMTGDAMGRPLIEALEGLEAERELDLDLDSLFVIASSAVVFSQSVKDQFIERFPNAMIIDSIGSTETGQNGMIAVTKEAKMSAGGPTVAAAPEAVVLDDELRPVPPGSGVVGRLARGGHIPLRYHNDPDKSAATFVTAADGNRYAVAGDNAVLEADGNITLLGRDSVCINSGGEKIFTEEVEAAVRAHPDVYDAIIVGVPDDRWGHRVAAVVQPRDGTDVTLETLDAHCRLTLAGYKVPRELHLTDHIERSEAGKPDYRWAKSVATGQVPV